MGSAFVTRAQIVQLLYLKDDRVIARRLEISVARVKHIRASHGRSKGRPRIDEATTIATDANISGWTIKAQDEDVKRKAARGSMLLLLRMLETGQHSLGDNGFHAACAIVGLITPTKSAA